MKCIVCFFCLIVYFNSFSCGACDSIKVPRIDNNDTIYVYSYSNTDYEKITSEWYYYFKSVDIPQEWKGGFHLISDKNNKAERRDFNKWMSGVNYKFVSSGEISKLKLNRKKVLVLYPILNLGSVIVDVKIDKVFDLLEYNSFRKNKDYYNYLKRCFIGRE